MSKSFSLLLLLTAMALTTTTTDLRHLSLSPSSSPSILPQLPFSTRLISQPPQPVPTLSPPPSPTEYMQQQQLKNIIDALIGSGDFAAWANVLFNPNANSSIPTTTTSARIPTTATMFVPGNDAVSRLAPTTTATGAINFDPYIIPYHILPQRLTFSELQLFRAQTRLPTLLPSKTIIITNTTPSNFTIDDSLITQPDIYQNAAVCVHGISSILDYNVYGDADTAPYTFLPPPPMLPPADESLTPPPQVVRNRSSMCDQIDGNPFRFLILLFVIYVCFESMSK